MSVSQSAVLDVTLHLVDDVTHAGQNHVLVVESPEQIPRTIFASSRPAAGGPSKGPLTTAPPAVPPWAAGSRPIGQSASTHEQRPSPPRSPPSPQFRHSDNLGPRAARLVPLRDLVGRTELDHDVGSVAHRLDVVRLFGTL